MKDSTGKISVIIPTYNRPAALCEALESLARQTYRNFEAIVVNDAGQSVDFVRELYGDLTITVLNQERNRKHVHARNRGITHASGEYIMFLDDDDMILPDHMERMAAELQACDFVYSDAEIFDYRVEGRTRVPTARKIFAYRFDMELMVKFNTFISTGCLYRKSIHDEMGLLDTEMYAYWDWDWILRVADRYRVKRVAAASALYAFVMGDAAPQAGANESQQHSWMRPHLDKLCAKHGLGELPTANFFVLLEEPYVQSRQAETRVLWDGQPIVSRYAQNDA
ncbi:glycosyltransferase family 2 protein [Paenibacillus sp. y28]|uniref:glycosyltransferase family 2 protein n=1 Tax=Paenibacillus sp. y28 TaxID=3129110 RepID=UPI003017D466